MCCKPKLIIAILAGVSKSYTYVVLEILVKTRFHPTFSTYIYVCGFDLV